jgi:hypothetical protein
VSADPTQALLLALAAGNSDAASEALAGVVDPDDPMSAVLKQLISVQAAADAPREPDVGADWSTALEPAFPVGELEELRRRNDQLAAALGACYLCWGEDPACPICGGLGAAGAAAPDPRYFALYVVPALNRLRRRPDRRRGLTNGSVNEQGR